MPYPYLEMIGRRVREAVTNRVGIVAEVTDPDPRTGGETMVRVDLLTPDGASVECAMRIFERNFTDAPPPAEVVSLEAMRVRMRQVRASERAV